MPFSLQYVAGIVDGEGCLGFTKIRNNIIPRLCVTNTRPELRLLLHIQLNVKSKGKNNAV